MTDEHTAYERLARQRRGSEEYRQGYAEARRAFLIGQAVRERRLALGLSQVELATRAGMTQPALSRLEAGGVVPTIPLLERISMALDADLIVDTAPPRRLNRNPGHACQSRHPIPPAGRRALAGVHVLRTGQ
jgi:ribosome-binding protein aMBF1 (putative translation factor)